MNLIEKVNTCDLGCTDWAQKEAHGRKDGAISGNTVACARHRLRLCSRGPTGRIKLYFHIHKPQMYVGFFF
ncbi:hypothetical protein Hanom_Chr03g00224851 [Helianthus anomalus]